MNKATSKRQQKRAKKAFAKNHHNTRPFTTEDYNALPSNPERKPTA